MTYPQDVDKKEELQFATPLRRFLPFVVGGVGVAMILVGVGYTYINNTTKESVENLEKETPQDEEFVKGVNTVKLVKVDIGGAVLRPGVAEVPADSRIQDVLISAGGFDAKADRIYISKTINLAQPVQDGMKIYVPFEGETISPAGEEANSTSFNINSASQAKLEELPGIGPVTAKKIIDGRPYTSTNDLLAKKVVSKAVFDKIIGQITIY